MTKDGFTLTLKQVTGGIEKHMWLKCSNKSPVAVTNHTLTTDRYILVNAL